MPELLKLQITVEVDDVAMASRQAQALQKIISEEGVPADIHRVRLHQDNLAGGATLALILASPVLVELVRCLQIFLNRYNSSQVTITDGNGSLVAKNVSSASVSEIMRKWSEKHDAG